MEQPTRVLILCTGNSARSQIAEALLQAHAGEHFEAHSAGLEPKGCYATTAETVLKSLARAQSRAGFALRRSK